MSTRQRLTIVAVVAAIVIPVGIGVFVAHDMNAPIQEVKVYELPDSINSRPAVAQATTIKKETIASGQQGRGSDTTTVQYSDEDTAAMSESAIEPCCPEEVNNATAGDIDLRQGINLDHNPVAPQVIADSKSDAEWFIAIQAYEARLDAHYAEAKRLDDEYHALLPDDPDEFLRSGDVNALIAKLEAHRAQKEAWSEKLKELEREKPIRPTPTHKH